MTRYIYLADILAWVIFLFIYAARPAHSNLSSYELHRLAKAGDAHAKKLQRRNALLPGALLIKHWVEIILAVLVVWLTVTWQGWLWGIIISIFALVIADLLSRWQPIKRIAKKYWAKLEPQLLVFIHAYANWLARLGPKAETYQPAVHSQQELARLIEASPAFNAGVKKHLQATLSFNESTLKDIMTPRDSIVTVNCSDTLGPVVLDSLHKTGLNYFPVIDGGIDNVVGILQLDKLVGDMRKTHTAKKVMSPHVSYLPDTATPHDAVATLLYERQNLLIIVDKSKKTTGIISLQTLIEKLIGRSLTDKNGGNPEAE